MDRSGIYSMGSISYDLRADEDERRSDVRLDEITIIFFSVYTDFIAIPNREEGFSSGRLRAWTANLHEDTIFTLAWLLIGKFYNRYSRPPAKTPSWPETVPLKIWHEFCLCSIVHLLAKGQFQSCSCSMFSASIVAYDEQDYDAFA